MSTIKLGGGGHETCMLRDAILRAADHIERHPKDFRYSSTEKPGCDTPGCALGWIGFFVGSDFTRGTYPTNVSTLVLGISELLFYERMDELESQLRLSPWIANPSSCAQALRAYADKYYPGAPGQDYIPESVRAIFSTPTGGAADDPGEGKADVPGAVLPIGGHV